MSPYTLEQIAYTAGIIDGEGSISCTLDNNGDTRLALAVGMLNPKVPTWLHEVWGGGLHTPKNQSGTYWKWQVSGRYCKDVLEAIQPYVLEKAPHVPLALEYIGLLRPIGGRQSPYTVEELKDRLRIVDKLRILNIRKNSRT